MFFLRALKGKKRLFFCSEFVLFGVAAAAASVGSFFGIR